MNRTTKNRYSRKQRLICSVFFGVAACVLGLAAAPASVSASSQTEQTQLDFDAQPLQPSPADPTISTYFFEKGTDGQTIAETLLVHNPHDQPLILQLAPVRAKTGLNGGIVYSNTADPDTWLAGLPAQITVPPQSSEKAVFQIHIPQTAAAGDYIFGLALADRPSPTAGQTTGTSDISVQIHQQLRRVIAVQVEIPGTAVAGIEFAQASILYEPSGAALDITGFNKSNFLLSGIEGKLTLLKDGRNIWSIPLTGLKLVPNAPFELKYRFLQGNPDIGTYTVKLDLTNSQIHQVHKELSFTETAQQLQKFQQLTGTQVVQRYIPAWVYWVIGGAALLLVSCLALVIQIMRKTGYSFLKR